MASDLTFKCFPLSFQQYLKWFPFASKLDFSGTGHCWESEMLFMAQDRMKCRGVHSEKLMVNPSEFLTPFSACSSKQLFAWRRCMDLDFFTFCIVPYCLLAGVLYDYCFSSMVRLMAAWEERGNTSDIPQQFCTILRHASWPHILNPTSLQAVSPLLCRENWSPLLLTLLSATCSPWG